MIIESFYIVSACLKLKFITINNNLGIPSVSLLKSD
jgi:hypothetical protein